MIFYHPELNKELSRFGITIPLNDKRADKLFCHLKEKIQTNQMLNCSLKSLTLDDLALVHSEKYCDQLRDRPQESVLKCYEGYCSTISSEDAKKIVSKVLLQAYGTYEAMIKSLSYDFVYYLGGGMHHAMKDNGRGFCLIHDIAIAIKKLQRENKVENVWIIDVDAHKGDGTSEIFQNDDRVRTLSIHMSSGWPLDGSEDDRVLVPSTIDIPVEGASNYQERLEKGVATLFENFEKPDLVCIVHGMDAWEGDELPGTNSLGLSTTELLKRDKYLFSIFKENELSQLYVMAGGYGKNSWKCYANFIEWALKI